MALVGPPGERRPVDSREHDEPGEGPLYEACSITVLEPELRWNAEHRTRDLDLLFPGWEARLERR